MTNALVTFLFQWQLIWQNQNKEEKVCFGLQLETHFIMARKVWDQEWVKLWQQECGSHCVSIVRKQNVGPIVSTVRKQNMGTTAL